MPSSLKPDSTLMQAVNLTDRLRQNDIDPGEIASSLISCAIVTLINAGMSQHDIRTLINETLGAAFVLRPPH